VAEAADVNVYVTKDQIQITVVIVLTLIREPEDDNFETYIQFLYFEPKMSIGMTVNNRFRQTNMRN